VLELCDGIDIVICVLMQIAVVLACVVCVCWRQEGVLVGWVVT
jgi:hypothetical protein